MVHEVAGGDSSAAAVRHVHEVCQELFDPGHGTHEKLAAVFARETGELELPDAYLSRVHRAADREVFEVVHADQFDIEAGGEVPLSQSFCRETIDTAEGSLAISDAEGEGWADHPAHQHLGVDAYLGTTVEVEDDLYGTLCFVSPEAREQPIAEPEIEVAQLLAEWTGYELTQRATDASDITTTNPSAVPVSLWPDEVDTLLQALSARPRRLLLAALAQESGETVEDALAIDGIDNRDVVALQHNHLPRLADAGYVEWDRDAGTIATGPEFEAVERVLRCLTDNVDEIT